MFNPYENIYFGEFMSNHHEEKRIHEENKIHYHYMTFQIFSTSMTEKYQTAITLLTVFFHNYLLKLKEEIYLSINSIIRVLFNKINEYCSHVLSWFIQRKIHSTELIQELAFDTLDHKHHTIVGLLHKLNHCGFKGSALNLMKCYLTDWKNTYYLRILYLNKTIVIRLQQGSILGPFWFIIYIKLVSKLCYCHDVIMSRLGWPTWVIKSLLFSGSRCVIYNSRVTLY